MIQIIKANRFILFSILILAALLRFWKLDSIPPHLSPDEASLGYNAYSILKTGKDEYGEVLPMIFKSFGDYKPGLYVYLSAPFVATLGLNEFTVRLPSAIAGIAIIYLIYLVTKKLFKNERLSLLAAFVACVNPWLIYFARGAWEANVSLALTLLGVYFFLKSLEKNKLILVSAIFFALTLLSYQGAKLSTAIVVTLLGLLFINHLKRLDKKIILGSLAVGIIISLPILASVYSDQAGRLSVVSVFSYSRSSADTQKILKQGNESVGGAPQLIFHSEALNWVRVIMGKWFNHFSARFLFFEGDWENPRHNSPNMGMFLLVDAFLIILGIIKFIGEGRNKFFLFIILWLVFAPLPSILSRDQVHAIRSLNMAIPLIIISSFGLDGILKNLNKKFVGKGLVFVFIAIYLLNYVYYLDSYFVHLPVHNAKYWGYGYKQVVEYINESGLNSRNIVFQESYDQPFIYFLFYRKLNPLEFQRNVSYKESSVGDVGLVEKLGNINFRFLSWPYKYPAKTIVVADEVAAPKELVLSDYTVLKEILRPDGSLAFLIMEAK